MKIFSRPWSSQPLKKTIRHKILYRIVWIGHMEHVPPVRWKMIHTQQTTKSLTHKSDAKELILRRKNARRTRCSIVVRPIDQSTNIVHTLHVTNFVIRNAQKSKISNRTHRGQYKYDAGQEDEKSRQTMWTTSKRTKRTKKQSRGWHTSHNVDGRMVAANIYRYAFYALIAVSICYLLLHTLNLPFGEDEIGNLIHPMWSAHCTVLRIVFVAIRISSRCRSVALIAQFPDTVDEWCVCSLDPMPSLHVCCVLICSVFWSKRSSQGGHITLRSFVVACRLSICFHYFSFSLNGSSRCSHLFVRVFAINFYVTVWHMISFLGHRMISIRSVFRKLRLNDSFCRRFHFANNN